MRGATHDATISSLTAATFLGAGKRVMDAAAVELGGADEVERLIQEVCDRIEEAG